MKIKTIFLFALGPISSVFLGFLTLPIITWLYSAEDIGRISILIVASNFVVLIFSFGLDQAYVREYNEHKDKGKLFKMVIWPGMLLLLLVAFIFYLYEEALSSLLFSIANSTYSNIILLFFISSLLYRFVSLIQRMQFHAFAYSIGQILPKITLIILIVTFFIFKIEKEFDSLLLAYFIANLAGTFFVLFKTQSILLLSLKSSIDWGLELKLLKYSTPLILGGMAYWGLTAIDKAFILHYSSFDELGVYSVAISFASAAAVIERIFSIIWAPVVFKKVSNDESLGALDKVRDYLLFAVIVLFIFTGLFSWLITFLLPEKYSSIPYLLAPCLAAPIFYLISEVTVIGLSVQRRTNLIMLASLLAFVCNLIGNYILVPRYGGSGAAISTAISFWFFFFLRTEFSNWVWRPIKRLKLYSLTSLALVTSIMFNLYGEEYFRLFIGWWCLMLVVLLITCKEVVYDLYLWLNKKLITSDY